LSGFFIIAEKLMVDVGDMIQVSTAKGRRLSLKVVGIYQLGVAEIDAVQSYASLQTVQNVMGKSSN
jgi:lipoprotein-releasing system permease protein